MGLSGIQRGVVKGMVLGACASICGLGISIVLSPSALVPEAEVSARIAFALQWDILLAGCLAVSIGRLAHHRFVTPEDIDGSGLSKATPRARILQAILQNTLEQVVLAMMAHVLWALALPSPWQPAIPCAALLFVIGRIVFWRAYTSGATARALGFALTFYPSVAMLLITAAALLVGAIASA